MRHTRSEIIERRLCGLKDFDAAVSLITKQNLIKQAIRVARENELVSSDPWLRLGWAAANVVMDTLRKDVVTVTANLDEMFDQQEMEYIAREMNITLPDTNARRRRKA